MNEFVPHSDKQDAVIFSDEDTTVVGCGTQWGKSQSGTLWMKRQTHVFNERTDNFLIGAPTYKILQQSIIPYFEYYMSGFGEMNRSEAVFRLHHGGTVYFRTETDPDSIVGIPNIRAGWLDEAGKLRLYFWENYQARAAAKGAKTLLTTSPYSLNWLWKQIVKPMREGKNLPGVKLIQAASWENPYHTLHDPVKREQMRATMDPRRFDMIFGGEWGQMVGLVYDCWDDAVNLIDEFQLPTGTRYFGGIDWGYNDPFVLKVRAVTPDGRHYGVSEFVKARLTVTDIIAIAKQKKETFGIEKFYADPSQPGSIEEMNRNGLTVVPADNDIRRGIDLHYDLIKSARYKEFRGKCPHSADEREMYHYPEPEDLGPDDNAKEPKPVDQHNHCMDTDRYLTLELYRTGQKHRPAVPNEQTKPKENTERLAFLKRSRERGQSERFS